MHHPRVFDTDDDLLDPTPLGGLAGCLVSLLLAAAVLLVIGVVWLWAR